MIIEIDSTFKALPTTHQLKLVKQCPQKAETLLYTNPKVKIIVEIP